MRRRRVARTGAGEGDGQRRRAALGCGSGLGQGRPVGRAPPTSTGSSGSLALVRLPQAPPSLEAESSPSETSPSALTAPALSETSYQFPALDRPELRELARRRWPGGCSRSSTRAKVFELMAKTRPPVSQKRRAGTCAGAPHVPDGPRPRRPGSGRRIGPAGSRRNISVKSIGRAEARRGLRGVDPGVGFRVRS